jgi:hypothetical protein
MMRYVDQHSVHRQQPVLDAGCVPQSRHELGCAALAAFMHPRTRDDVTIAHYPTATRVRHWRGDSDLVRKARFAQPVNEA